MLLRKINLILVIACLAFTACQVKPTDFPITPIPSTMIPTDVVPTPTRTRPPRSFFVRPTLAQTPLPPTLTPILTTSEIASPYPGPETGNPIPPEPTRAPSDLLQTNTPRPGNPNPARSTPSASPTSAATAQNAEIASPALLSFFMIDSQNGWGLTDRAILRTTNGGEKWVNTTPGGSFPANSILQGFFLNANEGWVLLPSSDLMLGTLYRTNNGGNTWQNWAVAFGGAHLFFLNQQIGWALADRGSTIGKQAIDIYQTTDGGENWSLISQVSSELPDYPGQLPLAGTKSGILFRETNIGWVTGSIQSPGQSWLFITRDGGRTWSQQNLVLPSGNQSSTLKISPPYFSNAEQGVLPVRLSQVSELTNLYLTNDGGETWTTTLPVAVTGPLDCVSYLSCRIWNGVTLASTDDGGTSWQQVRTNIDLRQSLLQIDFINPTNGFALSVLGPGVSQFYRTTDGGRTWIPTW